MKKMSKVFLGIGALALLSSGALAISLAVNPKEAVKAEAISFSDKVYLELKNDWKSSSSKIALYLFNNTTHENAWGGFVTPNGTQNYIEYPYSVGFQPEGCIAWRLDPGVETCGQWCFDNNRSNTAIWSTTNDISFADAIWLGAHYQDSKWTESGSYDIDTFVKGGSTDNWSVATVDTELTHTKINGSGNLELYGEVTLPADTYFKINTDSGTSWHGTYSANPLIASNLETSAEGNIHNTAAAKYEVYFDYYTKSSYINDPIQAAADDWGLYFRNHSYCDATGATAPTGWDDVATEYGKLDGDVKDYIYDLTAVKGGTYIQDALWNYDWAIAHHDGLSHFITDSTGTHVRESAFVGNTTPSVLGNVSNTAVIATVVIVSLVAVTTIGGIIILKRKER